MSLFWFYAEDLPVLADDVRLKVEQTISPSNWSKGLRRAFVLASPVSGPLLIMLWVIGACVWWGLTILWIVGLILFSALLFLTQPLAYLRELWR